MGTAWAKHLCMLCRLRKAFDRVDWKKLMNALPLRRIGVHWKDRRLIENLYIGQKVRIRIEGDCSETGVIGR